MWTGREEKGCGGGGLGKETKNEAVDSEHWASKGESLLFSTNEPPFHVRGYLFTFIYTTHAVNIV